MCERSCELHPLLSSSRVAWEADQELTGSRHATLFHPSVQYVQVLAIHRELQGGMDEKEAGIRVQAAEGKLLRTGVQDAE